MGFRLVDYRFGPLLRAASAGALISTATEAVGFLASVVSVTFFHAERFGQYLYILGITLFLPALFSSLDQAIIRFGGSRDEEKRFEMATCILLLKALGGLLAVGSVILFWCGSLVIPDSLGFVVEDKLWMIMAAMLLLQSVMTAIDQTLVAYTQVQGRYLSSQYVALAVAIVDLALIASLGRTMGEKPLLALALYLCGKLIFQALRMVALLRVIARAGASFKFGVVLSLLGSPRSLIKRTFDGDVCKYVLPLLGLSLMPYVKKQIPALMAGAMLGMDSTTKVKIVSMIFEIVGRTVPNAMTSVFAGVAKVFESRRQYAMARIQELAKYYVYAMAGIAGLIFIFREPICGLWAISVDNSLTLFIGFMGLDLIASAAMQVEQQSFLLARDTRPMLLASPLRQGLSVGISYLLLQTALGISGVAIGRLLGTIMIWLNATYWAISFGVRRRADAGALAFQTACCMGAISCVIVGAVA